MDESEAFWIAWDALPPAEKSALMRRCRGMSNAEVAYDTKRAESTIKNTIRSASCRLAPFLTGDPDRTGCSANLICWRYGYELGKRFG